MKSRKEEGLFYKRCKTVRREPAQDFSQKPAFFSHKLRVGRRSKSKASTNPAQTSATSFSRPWSYESKPSTNQILSLPSVISHLRSPSVSTLFLAAISLYCPGH
ncbi:hypothetical protein MRB53_013470 [Persea americana]|uniref:Uncharacterized protein n=1 Tax=Persea americana TaxID=3435 RepID=A0ACC2K840_PERAE|nr:hypothetical protein MRB53_013470 [Persea americana]